MKRTIPESFSGVVLFFLMLGAHGAFANTYDCTTSSTRWLRKHHRNS